jgi:hypothetical protein
MGERSNQNSAVPTTAHVFQSHEGDQDRARLGLSVLQSHEGDQDRARLGLSRDASAGGRGPSAEDLALRRDRSLSDGEEVMVEMNKIIEMSGVGGNCSKSEIQVWEVGQVQGKMEESE